MKILICPLHYWLQDSGSEVGWAYEYLEHLKDNSFTAVVANEIDKLKSNQKAHIAETQKDRYQISTTNSLFFHLKCYIKGGELLRKEKFDIIHHFLPFAIGSTFNLLALDPRNRKIPFIVGPIQPPQTFLENNESLLTKSLFKIFLWPSRLTLKRAKVVIVVNEDAKERLIKQDVDKAKIKIIPPGIDTSQFSYEPKKIESSIKIISVGQLIPRKGTDLLIKAVELVLKNGTEVTLDIFGDGPEKEALENLTTKLKLNKNVKLHGRVPRTEIHKHYSKAHIFTNMSRSEGFATVCLEAMACGLAVISSEVGGYKDAISDGVNGYLVKKDDYQELAKKITYLAKNPNLITKFSEKCRALVLQQYDWDDAIIPKYTKLYEEMIK